MYRPNKWLLVKIYTKKYGIIYKVFGTWGGGYLDSDAWRLNSGISKIQYHKDFYFFEGFSGSIYRCYKNSYGVTGASNMAVLNGLKNKGCEILDEKEANKYLRSFL